MSDVIAKVISQKGNCEAHKVGDEFVIGEQTPPNVCSWAFHSLFPFAQVLQFGGSFPWEKDKNKAIVACPDPTNQVMFELRRTSPSRRRSRGQATKNRLK
jgi:uncharacterized repeat protein (TIGR04076 family)